MSILLESAGSDLGHIIHVNVFLLYMSDIDDMNRVYAECLGFLIARPGLSSECMNFPNRACC